jgi:hypothetical protein
LFASCLYIVGFGYAVSTFNIDLFSPIGKYNVKLTEPGKNTSLQDEIYRRAAEAWATVKEEARRATT